MSSAMSTTKWQRSIDAAIETLVELCRELHGDDADEVVDCYRMVVLAITKDKGIRPAAIWLEERVRALRLTTNLETGSSSTPAPVAQSSETGELHAQYAEEPDTEARGSILDYRDYAPSFDRWSKTLSAHGAEGQDEN